MYSTRRTTSRLAILFSLLAMAVFAIAGCGSGSDQPVTPDSQTTDLVSSPESASPADQGTTVSGQVVDRDTGQPYAGAIVEFKNLYGYEVHTTTDTDGNYSLKLDPGTYTAVALDLNNLYEAFDLAGRPDNAVTVPPSTTINFVAYPIT